MCDSSLSEIIIIIIINKFATDLFYTKRGDLAIKILSRMPPERCLKKRVIPEP
jgi:hypothetical protein